MSSTRIHHNAHDETQPTDKDLPSFTSLHLKKLKAQQKLEKSQTNLAAVDETRPAVENNTGAVDSPGRDEKVCAQGDNSSTSLSAQQRPPWQRKPTVKSRLRGLRDRYVAFMHAVDDGGDMRGNMLGGHTFVHSPQPFRTDVDPTD